MSQGEDLTLKELELIWYAKLKEQGFEDIENTGITTRPLKDWHSFKFIDESSQARQKTRSEYQKKADDFINREDLKEICLLIVKHGNNTLTAVQIESIWELHLQGFTERGIAHYLKRSKTCIHGVIERVRTWMIIL